MRTRHETVSVERGVAPLVARGVGALAADTVAQCAELIALLARQAGMGAYAAQAVRIHARASSLAVSNELAFTRASRELEASIGGQGDEFALTQALAGAVEVPLRVCQAASDLVLLLKEASTAGLKVKFGTMFLDLPGSLESAGPAALGYYTVESSNKELGGNPMLAIYNDYNKRMGHDPSSSEIRTVFGLQVLESALNTLDLSKTIDVTAIARALEKAKVETPIGEISVRPEDHQAIVPLIVSKVSPDAKFKREGLSLGFKPVRVVPGSGAINPVQPSCKMERPAS